MIEGFYESRQQQEVMRRLLDIVYCDCRSKECLWHHWDDACWWRLLLDDSSDSCTAWLRKGWQWYLCHEMCCVWSIMSVKCSVICLLDVDVEQDAVAYFPSPPFNGCEGVSRAKEHLNLLDLFSQDLRVVLTNLFLSMFLVIKGAVMFIGVSMDRTEVASTSTGKTNDSDLYFALRASVLPLLLRV